MVKIAASTPDSKRRFEGRTGDSRFEHVEIRLHGQRPDTS